ncbi:MAG: YIP1 family protein [Candidatus Micrarchaeota archaeon]|nr:YIP1 family protein [Candidatus Micrarchaeota archaeon]
MGLKRILPAVEATAKKFYGIFRLQAFQAWLSAYFHPVETFEKEKKKASLGGALKILLSITVSAAVILAIIIFLLRMLGLVQLDTELGAMPVTAGGIALMFVILLIASLFASIIVFLFGSVCLSLVAFAISKLLGGKGGFFQQTCGLALVEGGMLLLAIPFVSLGEIKLVGPIFSIVALIFAGYAGYSVYLILKQVHQLSKRRIAITIFLSAVITPIIMTFLLIFAALMLSGPIRK